MTMHGTRSRRPPPAPRRGWGAVRVPRPVAMLAVFLGALAVAGITSRPAPAAPGASVPGDGRCSGCDLAAATGGGIRAESCSCHYEEKGWYHHPVDVKPSAYMAGRIPTSFPLEAGLLTCITCHEVRALCQNGAVHPRGYRGTDSTTPWAPCYDCHDGSEYQRFNTHDQLDARGRITTRTCLYCHNRAPAGRPLGRADLRLTSDIAVLCQRCHPMGAHPGGQDHLVVPSEKMAARIAALETDFNVVLARDTDGTMTCITCHNPHERGVIPVYLPNARGASESYQQRLPNSLCVRCHEK